MHTQDSHIFFSIHCRILPFLLSLLLTFNKAIFIKALMISWDQVPTNTDWFLYHTYLAKYLQSTVRVYINYCNIRICNGIADRLLTKDDLDRVHFYISNFHIPDLDLQQIVMHNVHPHTWQCIKRHLH